MWVGKPGDNAVQMVPLQLALTDPNALDYQAACRALDAARIPYRIAYASAACRA